MMTDRNQDRPRTGLKPADDAAAASAIPALYDRHADAFERHRAAGHWPELNWLQRFEALLAHGADVLDLGCGMGVPVARYFADRGFVVTGIDTSARMIARARVNVPSARFDVGDMRTIDLGHRYNGVVAWDSFFHLNHADQHAMFPVFAAHSAPGAALMFNTGPAHGIAMGEFEGEPLFHASLSPDEYRRLLDEAGFSVLQFAPEDASAGGRTVWLATKR